MLPLGAQTSEEEKKPKTKELDVSLINAHFTIKRLYYNRICYMFDKAFINFIGNFWKCYPWKFFLPMYMYILAVDTVYM